MRRIVRVMNPEDDGTSRTIKAQYYKNSMANYARQDSFGSTGVIEIYEEDSIERD